MDAKTKELKSKLRLDINRTLFSVAITIFVFTLTLKPEILKYNNIIPLQITFAIPLFLSSIFARSKLSYTTRPKMWEEYGFIMFLLGYSFILNSLGILLSTFISLKVGILFFVLNILVSLVYSTLEIIEEKNKFKSRLFKEILFIILIVLGGILPSLGVYSF